MGIYNVQNNYTYVCNIQENMLQIINKTKKEKNKRIMVSEMFLNFSLNFLSFDCTLSVFHIVFILKVNNRKNALIIKWI